jgi:DNA mismatch repair protein MSH4
LARVVGLPQDVLDKATLVSKALAGRLEKAKRRPEAYNTSKRRNLVLKLKEMLIQARDGTMEEETLRLWLSRVQDEFVDRMTDAVEDDISGNEDCSINEG